MSDRTITDDMEKGKTSPAIEFIKECQGLIIVTIAVLLFVSQVLVSETRREGWAAFSNLILSVGATALYPGDKKKIFQRGKNFESVEGDVIHQQIDEESKSKDEPSTY